MSLLYCYLLIVYLAVDVRNYIHCIIHFCYYSQSPTKPAHVFRYAHSNYNNAQQCSALDTLSSIYESFNQSPYV